MIIDLTRLSENVKDFAFTSRPDLEDDSARLVKPVEVTGKLRKRIAQIDVEGNIKGEIEIDCTRCLVPTKTILDVPFKAVFVTEENYTQHKEAEIRGEDLEV